MATDFLKGLTTSVDYLKEAVNLSQSFVKLTGTAGIAGFVFDIADESSVELVSEITDHYLEDGSPVQDHIAFKPEKVTLRGFVGEYRRIVNDKKDFVQKAAEKLVTVGSYAQPLSNYGKQLLSDAQNIDRGLQVDVVKVAGDLFKTYKNINLPQDNQSEAFLYFEALRNAKQTFTIQTPYRYYTDMAIETLKAMQTGQTKDESNFEITFKKIRYIQTTTTVVNGEGRFNAMMNDFVNKGLDKGQEIIGGISSNIGNLW